MKPLKLYLLIIIFSIFSNNLLFSQRLSENAKISLLTCNPGTELYSVFGHSAIRVQDYDKGIDWIYNYGTFDFHVPNFYMKFLRGYLNYQLTVNHMRDFLMEYQYENRSIYENEINLNQQEREMVFAFLEFNRLPENKYYLYDFFFDNCATRIRDIFETECEGSVKFSDSNYKPLTFRQMLKPYLEPQPWSRFGINLVLGAVADREATLRESMFLPDYMKMAFEKGKIRDSSLVQPTNVVFEQKKIDAKIPFFTRPGFIFWMLLIGISVITYFEIRNKRRFKLLDFLIFFSIGAIGLLLSFLWFATNHTAVVHNWNVLWALPFHFVIAFWLFRKSSSHFFKYYFLVTGVLAMSALVFWLIIPQQYDLAYIPLMLLVAVRSARLFLYYK